jgi:peroxiredoxin
VLAVAVFAVGLLLLFLGEVAPDPVIRGSAAPDFEARVLDGREPVGLDAYRGQVVLLNFWATWCKPCEDEMPAMQRLYAALAPAGFELLAVSVDKSAPEVAAFRDRLGLTFPILLDPDERVSRSYQTTGYPESFLIDADGEVLERYVGPREWDDALYVDRIRKLLGD